MTTRFRFRRAATTNRPVRVNIEAVAAMRMVCISAAPVLASKVAAAGEGAGSRLIEFVGDAAGEGCEGLVDGLAAEIAVH